MKQASKVYAKSMIQNNGGEEKKDDNGTQNKDNVGKWGRRDEWKVQMRNIESSQVDQEDPQGLNFFHQVMTNKI